MNNKEIIKNILIEELSKCNKFIYDIQINNLILEVITEKSYPSLINYCSWFGGYINTEWIFEFNKQTNVLWTSKNFISKFEKKTKLQYTEIQSIVKDILEKGFKVKAITAEKYFKIFKKDSWNIMWKELILKKVLVFKAIKVLK